MIRVLLVDDEFLVCSYLRQLIDWEGEGYQIVGQASNGAQAVEKINELRPDLIFLDVNMPEMDGIELIRYIHTEHPSIKVVMLSSYSDYHYVRETMKFGASDYILKHELNPEELSGLLKQLDIRPSLHAPKEESSWRLLRDYSIRRFFEGEGDGIPGGLHGLRKPVIVAARLKLPIVPIEVKDDLLWNSSPVRRILTTCTEIISQNGEAKLVFLDDARLIFLFSAAPAENALCQEQRVDRCMDIVRDTLLKYHNTYIEWKRGGRVPALNTLPRAYRKLMARPFVQPQAGLYRISIADEQQLIIAVSNKDKETVKRILGDVFALKDGREPLRGEFSILAGDILSLTVKLYGENRVSLPDDNEPGGIIMPSGGRNSDVSAADMHQAREYFSRLLTGLIDYLEGQRKFSWAVDAGIDYVQEHYHEDIGVPDIAGHIGMNSSYLSTLFKKETGMGLAQYIGRVRVQAAGKLMLIKNIPPTQVYEMAGFRNYNNFFNLFKETTGLSPKQFREEISPEWLDRFHPLKKLENDQVKSKKM
jgi:two-component system response regulator YesN